MARLWRAYHPGLPACAGEPLLLDEDESHHLRRVLRLEPGDLLAVFDGRGNERLATLEGFRGRLATVRVGEARPGATESPLDTRVFQGLARTDRMEWALQKATELGAGALHPLSCARSEGRPPDRKRLERWRRIAVEACKQCGRRRVPEIEPRDGLPPVPAGTLGLLLAPVAGAEPLGRLQPGGPPGSVWIAVGPEAGFTPEEVAAAGEDGWRPVSLGPRILRTESAAVTALTLVQARWGDLDSAPFD